jgi:hypothetical protein
MTCEWHKLVLAVVKYNMGFFGNLAFINPFGGSSVSKSWFIIN